MNKDLKAILEYLFGEVEGLNIKTMFNKECISQYEDNKKIIDDLLYKEEIYLKEIYPEYNNTIKDHILDGNIDKLSQASILFDKNTDIFLFYIILKDRDMISKAYYHKYIKTLRTYKIHKLLRDF